MKQLDSNGLRLCEYQGKLFERSFDYFKCSSAIFLRRFYYSNLLKKLDKNNSSIVVLDANEGLEEIENQFGKTSYGTIKMPKEVLFWMGYFYRYISYTRKVNTQFLFNTFSYEKIYELYQVYHTQDFEWCLKSLLDLYNLTEKYFDPNYRLANIIRNKLKQVRTN